MFNWLDNMRRQPLSKRRLIAFSITLLFTGALFVVWLTVWLPDFRTKEDVAQKNQTFETPKDNFMQNLSSAWAGVTGQVSNLKDTIKNINMPDGLSSGMQYSATSTATSIKTQADITVIEVSSTTESFPKN